MRLFSFYIKSLYFSVPLLLLSIVVFAQPPLATATLDRHEALEGDVVKLTLTAAHEKGITMQFPLIGQSIDSLEVLEVGEITKTTEGNIIRQMQEVSIIVFDSGYYGIPALEFSYTNEASGQGGKIRTDPLLLNVSPRPIDMQEDIKEIKAPIDLPLTWRDYLPWVIAALVLALLGLLIWWLYRRAQRKEEVITKYVVPPLPAHKMALQRFRTLEDSKLWQKGEVKGLLQRID